MKCKCGAVIPETRIQMNYRCCVSCSSEERVGAVDVVYHKTGNTIEITTGEIADKIRKLSKRSGFGTMSCLGASKTDNYNPKNLKHRVSTCQIGNEVDYEKTGEACMKVYDEQGLESALVVLDRAVRDLTIDQGHAGRIRRILQALELTEKPVIKPVTVAYHNINYKPEKIVDSGIEFMFRNWRH